MEESRDCWLEIRLSIAVAMRLKLCPTCRNSSEPTNESLRSSLKLPKATAFAAFCKRVTGKIIVRLNHHSKGVVIKMIKNIRITG